MVSSHINATSCLAARYLVTIPIIGDSHKVTGLTLSPGLALVPKVLGLFLLLLFFFPG